MATWPATLPQLPLEAGYSESTIDTSIRTSMDVGPAKVRRRISAGTRDHQMQFIMTSAQLSDFKTFYETTLLSGSLSYTWDHPRSGTNYSWRIKKAPQWSKQGAYYIVPLELEQIP
ncbi:MAG: hypothetical protein WC055_00465 [Melioribacteraceae bacterium]